MVSLWWLLLRSCTSFDYEIQDMKVPVAFLARSTCIVKFLNDKQNQDSSVDNGSNCVPHLPFSWVMSRVVLNSLADDFEKSRSCKRSARLLSCTTSSNIRNIPFIFRGPSLTILINSGPTRLNSIEGCIFPDAT